VSDPARALEIEALAGERFAAVGQTVLTALADSGLSGRRVANVVSWFIVAQLALGPPSRAQPSPTPLRSVATYGRGAAGNRPLEAA
jgi:hypothetical protein